MGSISDVVDGYDLLNNSDYLSAREDTGWRFIPLLGGSTHEMYGQVVDIDDKETTFISLLFEEDGTLEFYCNSIESMLDTWADAYELGAYQSIDEIEVEGHTIPLLEEDSDMVASIIRKNNPGVAEKAIEDISLLKTFSEVMHRDTRTKIIMTLRLLQRYKPPAAADIIIQSLKKNENLFLYENQQLLLFIAETLGELSERKAIGSLKTILRKTSYEKVKRQAEYSLTKLID
ncbi:HEAT repeat domain-containing protein [cf. Phormidesmis sp. LEGE 11477]|uniref:HEAT repeat domain-containing protein n=1 Tax=cf. Phormidesmis sp. LEGE 11477 TaxID=1828680 RepID=UPI0018826DBB|nr:HEAT repeat domain-containing protein [cf. Phormidesmis sp. LEGE 11477]MBE9061314.1 HEAT repeat domain-containing protein [cf. Phormidesmis sp. LEGE 11477]